MTTKQEVHSFRNNRFARKAFTAVIFSFALYGTLQFMISSTVLLDLRYFTNQSNVLVTIILGLYLFDQQDRPYFKYLAVVGLVNILMTGIIYHVIVNGLEGFFNVGFNGHIVHTFNPLLYPVFYFILVAPSIKIHQFWVSLIYPALYFVIFLITGAFTDWYPYNFMNPTVPGSDIISVLIFCLGVLLPVIAVFTVGLVGAKYYMEQHIKIEEA